SGAIDYLEQAAGIAGRDHFAARGTDVLHLSVQELAGHLGLRQVVNPGAAATPVGFRQLDEFQPGNGPQKLAGLRDDALPVAQVTTLMVRDRLRRGARGRLEADLREPFVD